MNVTLGQKSLLTFVLGTYLFGSSPGATAQQVTGKAAATSWKLADFALDLNASLAPDNHVWVGSGQVTVQPQARKTFGIGEWNAPPFAGRSFAADINMRLNGHLVPDAASYGKGDVGLLYQGGTWYLHQIVRQGTYQQDVDGQRLSVRATSELVPLTGQVGFTLKITLTNRGVHSVNVAMTPEVNPGRPVVWPLDKWEFGRPKEADEPARQTGPDTWQNEAVQLRLVAENPAGALAPNATMTTYFSFFVSYPNAPPVSLPAAAQLIGQSQTAWQQRLARATAHMPRLSTDIPGLSAYYRRSIASGLVCIWEHPDFVSQPFLATCGMDGGAVCAYLWDIAGYVPRMSSLMLGEDIRKIARNFTAIDLSKYYAVTPAGSGVGVSYAYSTWAFVSLVQEIFNHLGPDKQLYQEAKRLVLAAEQAYPEQHGLLDFGTQKNLLEMRGTGWEHITASPNAERAWNLDRLAQMAGLLKIDQKEAIQWQQRAKAIRRAVVDELWSSKAGWFISKTTDGKTDTTYSIQAFDTVRAGIGDESIRNAVFAHLKPGKFLGTYGVSRVSREDSVHYEVNDPDWSGGGAYMGEGPVLALTLYEQGRPELAWSVLQRFFWLGEHLAFFPQEQLADRPALPAHKRANVISGMCGAETILYGLLGFGPQPDGSVVFNPQPPRTGTIRLRGLGYRTHRFDIDLSATACRISMDGQVRYRGTPKRIKVL